MQNKNKIKQLIKHNCASYIGDKYGIPNYCCWKDGSCVFFGQDDPLPSCLYFGNGVLPVDEKLGREYKAERNMEVEVKVAKQRVKCKKCGGTFVAHSNRQAYCEKCKQKNRNEKSKIWMRQKRESKLNVVH